MSQLILPVLCSHYRAIVLDSGGHDDEDIPKFSKSRVVWVTWIWYDFYEIYFYRTWSVVHCVARYTIFVTLHLTCHMQVLPSCTSGPNVVFKGSIRKSGIFVWLFGTKLTCKVVRIFFIYQMKQIDKINENPTNGQHWLRNLKMPTL